MSKPIVWAACAHAALASTLAAAQADTDVRDRSGGVVTIVGARPTSLPSEIPATTESASREQIERTVNAIDAEDALKYLPSLLVRKRYVGDYNHAILSSRASGTGNSARSAVYADGMLLSNYLGNGVGGLSFAPRWEMVTPEEIERVDVLYGPFSAAYPGNAVGAVVDYTTRMPQRFEAHANAVWQRQPFRLYATDRTFDAWSLGAAVGDRIGALSWWLDVKRTDGEGQPLTFATRTAAAGTAGGNGVPVTGAVPGTNSAGQPWLILGTGTEYRSRQDHAKVKLAYDVTPGLRASYIGGWWRNASDNTPRSYLRDADGAAVAAGPVSIDGRTYAPPLGGADFAVTRETLRHWMHGAALKTHTQGAWDAEVSASRYDYDRDDKRQNAATNTLPAALDGGPGTIADGHGSGWTTLALKATWRPYGARGLHVVDVGAQQDAYALRYRTSAVPGDFRDDDAGAFVSSVRGDTRLQSLWAQDTWRFAADWTAVTGLRGERWTAHDGRTDASPTVAVAYPTRHVDDLSPKAALAWQLQPATVLKAALGRAVRMPTANELYGALSTTNALVVNDPGLAPERSWTGELSAEHDWDRATARLTLFGERTRDAIYSQTLLDPTVNRNVTRVQNVDRIGTRGVEAAFRSRGWLVAGLELDGSVTYADSEIERNAGFVAAPGDTLHKRQPNIPRWRATAVASWRFAADWTATLGARYSGRQYRTLNNADVNGDAYQGVSRYVVVDTRLTWRLAPRWTAALGVDNLTRERYWNFHPYPQRTYAAELKFDL